MKYLLLNLFLFSFVMVYPVFARADPFLVTTPTMPKALGEVIDEPQCFNLINEAPYTVIGSIHSNFFVRPDGIKTRHKANFKLKPKNFAEFCTSGPFYEGQKVDLVLKTFIPIFKCKTGVTGDVIINGRHKSEGGTETWAECL